MNQTPRPTIYNGIRMRSRLEAGYAQWLDTQNFTWEYEPECFASPRGQYLPDFLIRNVTAPGYRLPVLTYVEVKPEATPATLDTTHTQLGIILEQQPGQNLGILQIGTDGAHPYIWHPTRWLPGMWAIGLRSGLVLTVRPAADMLPWPDDWWRPT